MRAIKDANGDRLARSCLSFLAEPEILYRLSCEERTAEGDEAEKQCRYRLFVDEAADDIEHPEEDNHYRHRESAEKYQFRYHDVKFEFEWLKKEFVLKVQQGGSPELLYGCSREESPSVEFADTETDVPVVGVAVEGAGADAEQESGFGV